MIGDVVVDEGEEFVVTWSGGEGLIAPRDTKPSDHWEPPNRIYNRTGKHTKKEKLPTLLDVIIEGDPIND